MTIHYHSEEFSPIFSIRDRRTKTQRAIDSVTGMTGVVVEISSEINRYLDAASASEYETSEDRVGFLFPIFNELKVKMERTAKDFDSRMIILEKIYSFDFAWMNTTKIIDDMIKESEEQRKLQHRHKIITKISQQCRNKEFVGEITSMLPAILTNPEIVNSIKALEPVIKTFEPLIDKVGDNLAKIVSAIHATPKASEFEKANTESDEVDNATVMESTSITDVIMESTIEINLDEMENKEE